MKKVLAILIATFLVGTFVALIGCSDQNSSNPFAVSTWDNSGGIPNANAVTGDSTGIYARVMTIDQNSRMLTFYERPETVIALQNCEIVRLNNVNESPIPFAEVHCGDSLHVSGVRQQNNYVYAHRLQIHCDTCTGNYDIAFRDTIITIDYDGGFFTVVGRTETIMTDENTVIWGTINHIDNDVNIGDVGNSGSSAKMIWNQAGSTSDTVYTFADLNPGDIVEVKAKIIDENTLLAVKIKVASNCSYDYSLCENFEAYLASVDVDAQIVTFEGLAWIGMVCKGSLLTGVDGATLTLADFASGDYVAVKGIPYSGDTLKVCEMHMVE